VGKWRLGAAIAIAIARLFVRRPLLIKARHRHAWRGRAVGPDRTEILSLALSTLVTPTHCHNATKVVVHVPRTIESNQKVQIFALHIEPSSG